MEDKRRLYIIILSITSVIMLFFAVFFFIQKGNSENEKEQIAKEKEKMDEEMEYLIELEKRELRNDLAQAQADYDELLQKIDNDSLKFKLERERDRTQELLEELERTKATSAAEIKRLNKEIETLRAVLKDYTLQIAALSTENESLKKENTVYKEKNRKQEKQLSDLTEKTEQMTETIAIAAQLEAKNINVALLKKNGKTVSKIKNAKQISISFTIDKNVTSTTGEKTVYARIFNQDMELLVKNEENKFAYENKDIQYSVKRNFEYTGEETAVELFWNIEETLKKGEYKVYLFVDGNMIGEGTGSFK
jgi:chromosome segregation ATPase